MPIRDTKIGENVRIYEPCNIYESDIGDNTLVAAFVEIGKSKIGKNCSIQGHSYIPPGITIGDNVFVGPRVTFTNDLYPPSFGKHWKTTIINDNVSIGAGSIILPGIKIVENNLLGAGTVMIKSLLISNCLIVGNPGKFIGRICNCKCVLKPVYGSKILECKSCGKKYKYEDPFGNLELI